MFYVFFVGAAFNKCRVISDVPVSSAAILDVCMYHIYVLDPEISDALHVTGTTKESVSLTWSIGKTQHFDTIQVRQESGSAAGPIKTSSNSSHTVRSLRPGTKYEFYVQIQSFGKTARTNTTTATTGGTMPGLVVVCKHTY